MFAAQQVAGVWQGCIGGQVNTLLLRSMVAFTTFEISPVANGVNPFLQESVMGAITFSSPSGRSGHAASASGWMSPVQAVLAFLAPPAFGAHAVPNKSANQSAAANVTVFPQPVSPTSTTSTTLPLRTEVAVAFSEKASAKPFAPAANAGRSSCLKIVREFEPGKCRSSTGRLIISGRMADVCAALDRMATQGATSY